MHNSVEEGVSVQDLVHGRVAQVLNYGIFKWWGLVYFSSVISVVKGKSVFLSIFTHYHLISKLSV